MMYLAVFLCGVLVDLVYVIWVNAVTAKRVLPAATAAVAIGALGLFSITSVIGDGALAAPYLAGLGVGTVIGIKMNKEKKQ